MEDYKILWIDDDLNSPALRPDRDALEEQNCIITPITNPDAIQFDDIPSYDCIIIDLAMPTGNNLTLAETQFGSRTGFAVLKIIKGQYPNTKLVVYSVFDREDVRSYCKDNEIQYWIKFNILSDDFAKNIVKLIKGERL